MVVHGTLRIQVVFLLQLRDFERDVWGLKKLISTRLPMAIIFKFITPNVSVPIPLPNSLNGFCKCHWKFANTTCYIKCACVLLHLLYNIFCFLFSILPLYLIIGNVIYHLPIWILQWCQLRCQQHGSDHSSWLGSAWGSEHFNPSTFPIQNVKLRVKQKTMLSDIYFLALHCYAKHLDFSVPFSTV